MDIFKVIEEVIPTLHGWCSVPKAKTLAAAVLALRPELSVEIGVWGGRSLLPLALAHREIGRGSVIGIDPWNPADSVVGQTGKNAEWWLKVADHNLVYQACMKLLNEFGVQNIVQIKRARSNDVDPPPNMGVLHIDGNHGVQAVRDVQRYCPQIKPGGLCFMDDVQWEGGTVSKAVDQLKTMGFTQLYSLDTGAVFQRNR